MITIIQNPLLAAVALLLLLLLVSSVYYRRTQQASKLARPRLRTGEVVGRLPLLTSPAQVPDIAQLAGLADTCNDMLHYVEGNSIAVTSATTSSGVTTTAIALARLLAGQGQRTLLIDMNFVHPMTTRRTGKGNIHGIGNYLLSGLVDDIVVQDSSSSLDVIGTGNVPLARVQELLAGNLYQDSLKALMALYDKVVIDCPASTEINIDSSGVAALCDLRLLVVDAQIDNATSEQTLSTLQTHQQWLHGVTLILLNKISNELQYSAQRQIIRPIHNEGWIVRQQDDHYTLQLGEFDHRPTSTQSQTGIGLPLACFRMTIMSRINYLMIAGVFTSEDEALTTAASMGLSRQPLNIISFATIKAGIKRELKQKSATDKDALPAASA